MSLLPGMCAESSLYSLLIFKNNLFQIDLIFFLRLNPTGQLQISSSPLSQSEESSSAPRQISSTFSSRHARALDFIFLMVVNANCYLDGNSPDRWAPRYAWWLWGQHWLRWEDVLMVRDISGWDPGERKSFRELGIHYLLLTDSRYKVTNCFKLLFPSLHWGYIVLWTMNWNKPFRH